MITHGGHINHGFLNGVQAYKGVQRYHTLGHSIEHVDLDTADELSDSITYFNTCLIGFTYSKHIAQFYHSLKQLAIYHSSTQFVAVSQTLLRHKN